MKTIITNNRTVSDEKFIGYLIEYHDVDSLDILYIVRDKIHEGAVLMTHPLSGSIKPNENPYKSILIDDVKGKLDYKSLDIIEKAILVFKKFRAMGIKVVDDYDVDKDYSLIDYTLISSFL